MPCHLTHTTAATHALIEANLHETPKYGGWADSKGPRYCPSIEDKIVRFKDKDSHQVCFCWIGDIKHIDPLQGFCTLLAGDGVVGLGTPCEVSSGTHVVYCHYSGVQHHTCMSSALHN